MSIWNENLNEVSEGDKNNTTHTHTVATHIPTVMRYTDKVPRCTHADYYRRQANGATEGLLSLIFHAQLVSRGGHINDNII